MSAQKRVQIALVKSGRKFATLLIERDQPLVSALRLVPQVRWQVALDLELVDTGLVHFEVSVELGVFERNFALPSVDHLRALTAEHDEVLAIADYARMLVEIS